MNKLLPFFFVFLTNVAICQDSIKNINVQWGFVYGLRTMYLDFDNLNSRLSSSSLPNIEKDPQFAFLGFSIRDVSKSSYMQFKAGYYDKTFASSSSEITFMKSLFIETSFVYNFLNSYKTILYPKVTLGYAKNILGVFNNNNSSLDFSYLLNNPNDTRFYSNGLLYSDVGAGFEKRIKIFYSNLFIGINSAYHININNLKWRDINDNYIQNFPKINLNCLIIEVTGRLEIDWQKIMTLSKPKK